MTNGPDGCSHWLHGRLKYIAPVGPIHPHAMLILIIAVFDVLLHKPTVGHTRTFELY